MNRPGLMIEEIYTKLEIAEKKEPTEATQLLCRAAKQTTSSTAVQQGKRFGTSMADIEAKRKQKVEELLKRLSQDSKGVK